MTTHAQPGAAARGFTLHLHLQGGPPPNDAALFRAAHAAAAQVVMGDGTMK